MFLQCLISYFKKRNLIDCYIFFIYFYFFLFPQTIFSADFKWHANMRFRFRTDTSSDVLPGIRSTFSETRNRLGTSILGNNASAHFIIQDSRVLGSYNNLDYPFFHQAYLHFRYNRYLIQIGRFELPYGKERILSKKNWNNTGLSFDGLVLKRRYYFGELDVFSLPIIESFDINHDNNKDNYLYGFYFSSNLKTKTVMKAFEVYLLDFQTFDLGRKNNIYTFGTRLESFLYQSFYLEGESARQYGKNISASILSINLFYKPIDILIIKNISVGFEYITGEDSSAYGKNGFSKIFGAGHKYHGYYDYKKHRKFLNHEHEGLIEFNIKGEFSLFEDYNIMIGFHHFNNQITGKHFGKELDIVIKNTISSELSFSQGLALYKPNKDKNLLYFYYLMISVNLP